MMLLLTSISYLAALSSASFLPHRQHLLSNSPLADQELRIPSVAESAVQARRIQHLASTGTLSTVFPGNAHNHSITSPENAILPLENRPSGLEGVPIGMMEYFADCEPRTGDPTILALTIATSFKNIAAGSNATLSVQWQPPAWSHYSAAALPRFSLVGYLEDISAEDVIEEDVAKCFTQYHPDARYWLPGNRIHESRFTRLKVEEIYWVGGFGDRAYIGWIPAEVWRNVTIEEVESIRLPGETKESFW